MPLGKAYDVSARYVEKAVNTPAKNLLVNTTWDLSGFVLDELQVLYPQGLVGLVGFRILLQGVAIVPWNQPTVFLVGNNERRIFEANIQMAHPLTIQTGNGDTTAHNLYLVAKLRDIPLASDNAPHLDLVSTPIVAS